MIKYGVCQSDVIEYCMSSIQKGEMTKQAALKTLIKHGVDVQDVDDVNELISQVR